MNTEKAAIKNIDNIKLMNIILETLDELYEKEYYLFENNSSERNMVFHFSRYFMKNLKQTEFENYNVDCEYNGNVFSKKGYKEIWSSIEQKNHRIYPDMIVHERGNNSANILAFEFKKGNNYNIKSKNNDIYKLKVLTSNNYQFRYKLGLLITFGKSRKSTKIIAFKNGDEISL